MDFSGRRTSLYVTLGHGAATRRRAFMNDGGTTELEGFLGTRLHGFTTIVRVERGTGFIATAAGHVAIAAGDTAVLPPGSIGYAFTSERCVEIDAGMIVRTAHLPADLFERPDGVVIDVLRAAPVVAHLPRSTYERSVMRALEALDSGPSSARLKVVAQELGYTADGLSSLLVRHTGTGFAAWRDALTMAQVRAALAAAKPVVRIARDLDLEPNYLHRRFARSHGVTPSRWRKSPALPLTALAHDWDSILGYFNAAKNETPDR